MKHAKFLFISLSCCLLALSACGNSSSPASSENTESASSDSEPTSVTPSSEDPSSEDTGSEDSSGEEPSSSEDSSSSESSDTVPEPTAHKINLTCSEHAYADFGEIDLNALYADDSVSFTVSVDDGYQLDSVVLNEETLSDSEGVYSFVMPDNDVSLTVTASEIPAPATYHVSGVNTEHITFNVLGTKEEFCEGDNVMFTATVVYGYRLNGFTLTRDDDGSAVEYTGTTLFEFTMPNSDVTVTFDVEKLYSVTVNSGEHISVTVSPDSDYHASGSTVSFTAAVVSSGYELDTVTVADSGGSAVAYTVSDGTYSFTMPNSDVTVTVTEKEAEVIPSSDPFTSVTTFNGTWDYYNTGDSTQYHMFLRIIFNGDGTLSWYLTFTYDEDEWEDWTVSENHEGPSRHYIVYSKPSDMEGTLKDGETNVEYTYDKSNDRITFTAKNGERKIQINRSGDTVTSITMLTNMGGDGYYASINTTLTK